MMIWIMVSMPPVSTDRQRVHLWQRVKPFNILLYMGVTEVPFGAQEWRVLVTEPGMPILSGEWLLYRRVVTELGGDNVTFVADVDIKVG